MTRKRDSGTHRPERADAPAGSRREPTTAATGRRRVLRWLGAGGLAAIAGCSGGGDGSAGAGGTPTTATSISGTPATTTAPSSTDTPPGRNETATGETSTPTDTPLAATPEERAVELVRLYAAGDFEAADALYTDRLSAELPPSRARSAWERLTGDAGQFRGVAGTERTTRDGTTVIVVRARFAAGALEVLVSVTDDGRVAGVFFRRPAEAYSPPEYADRSAFSERTATVSGPACDLGATLSVPGGDGTVPGAVVVHGSGPLDRDGTVGPNRPYRDLAWGLASRGVAVLRYDKRTLACDVDPSTLSLSALVVNDALAAVERLRREPRVGQVVVVGHSLGGLAAPRILERDGDLGGAGLLAAPARPLPAVTVDQVRYLAELDGTVTDREQRRIDAVREDAERIRAGDYAAGDVLISFPGAFWDSVRSYDQVATAAGGSRPLLVTGGGRDYQVTVEAEFGRWRDALDGRSNVRFERYPRVNHLLVPGEGTPGPAEYFRPGNVARSLVEDLAGWVGDAATTSSE